MKDKLNITIRIAQLPPIPLQIRREEEPTVRTAEYNVNQLWKAWMQRFSDKSPQEVLAMVAFQFAKTFVVLNRQAESTAKVLDDFEKELDRILLDTGNPLPSEATATTNDKSDAGSLF